MANHYNWKIHKKLEEARTVYILPARGQEHGYLSEVLNLMADGKKVVVIHNDPAKKLKSRRPEYSLIDKDILSSERLERAERFLNDFLKGERL